MPILRAEAYRALQCLFVYLDVEAEDDDTLSSGLR